MSLTTRTATTPPNMVSRSCLAFSSLLPLHFCPIAPASPLLHHRACLHALPPSFLPSSSHPIAPASFLSPCSYPSLLPPHFPPLVLPRSFLTHSLLPQLLLPHLPRSCPFIHTPSLLPLFTSQHTLTTPSNTMSIRNHRLRPPLHLRLRHPLRPPNLLDGLHHRPLLRHPPFLVPRPTRVPCQIPTPRQRPPHHRSRLRLLLPPPGSCHRDL